MNEYDLTIKAACDLATEFMEDISAEGEQFAGTQQQHGPLARWLTLSGVTGCGKTMIAEQLFREARKHNPALSVGAWRTGSGYYSPANRRPLSFFMTATEFADRVRENHGYADEMGREFLVVIDDLGAARDKTTYIAEAIYRLCNARLGKWTIFTSNFSVGEIARSLDERIASRMIRGLNVFHRINAGDYALRKTK